MTDGVGTGFSNGKFGIMDLFGIHSNCSSQTAYDASKPRKVVRVAW
jgi:hypothetical protein